MKMEVKLVVSRALQNKVWFTCISWYTLFRICHFQSLVSQTSKELGQLSV